ncbi:insecticidal delta-endotoxin Cry8Ea1 family protein, partial [Bacillus cereus]
MNQNYNNNAYEILDNGGRGCQTRYPFSQPPCSEAAPSNFCSNTALLSGFSNNVRNALIIGTGISWAVLGVAGPYASVAAGILNVIIPYLWPEDVETTQPQFSWDQLMEATVELINKAIAEEAKRDAIDALQILEINVNHYNTALCNYRQNPDKDIYKSTLRNAFTNVEIKAREAISKLDDNPATHAIQFLPSYAEAANIHLLLLRDVVQHGESWGFTSIQVQQYYDNPPGRPGNPGMKQLVGPYTDYCVRWYNAGLQEQYQTGDWNKFNNYRTMMTVTMLDIVSFWPNYDPIVYPILPKSELTRTVYTPLLGYSGNLLNPQIPIATAESNLVDIPRLFPWLRELRIDSKTRPGGFGTYISGRQPVIQYTLGNEQMEGGFRGELGETRETLRIPSPQDKDDVWRICTTYACHGVEGGSAPLVYGWSFAFTKSADQALYDQSPMPGPMGLPCIKRTSDPCDPCSPCEKELPNLSIPCNDKNLYSHRFSYLGAGFEYSPIFGYSALWYFSYGWTHVSADPNNLIDLEKVTQIPAVKANLLTGNARVIKGPGSTGGDLVELSSGTEQKRIDIPVTIPAGARSYRIRIRYASDMNTNLLVFLSTTFDEFTAPATTTNMTNLTYNKFGYLETIDYLSDQATDFAETLRIYATGSNDSGIFLLDKIEFIPIEGSVEVYQANQALEKARKAVNALFTNDAKNALKLHVTDYLVDQAAKLVECMSDEIYPQEKMCLLDLV